MTLFMLICLFSAFSAGLLTHYMFNHFGIQLLPKQQDLQQINHQEMCGQKFNDTSRQWFCSGNIPMYYINLDRSPHRRKYMEATFGTAGNLTRVPAVDAMSLEFGSAFGVDLQDNNTRLAFCEAQGAVCGEVALSASHYRAIKMALTDNVDVALILEDDASIILAPFWTKTLEETVKEADSTNPNWKIIRLQWTPHGYFRTFYQEWMEKPQGFFTPSKLHVYGSVAYLIRRPAMEKIVQNMSRPDDHNLFDCSGREGATRCKSDHWLFSTYPSPAGQILLRVPPMLTVRLYEENTGVRVNSDHQERWRTTFHEQSVLDSMRLVFESFDYWLSEVYGSNLPIRRISFWVVDASVSKQ